MPTPKKKAKKTGKYKSAMSGKFVKPDAANDNPYTTYKVKKDTLKSDIKKTLKAEMSDKAKLIYIAKLVGG